MPYPIPASLLEVDLHPGKPPILHTDTPDDAPGWAAEHHHALRTLATEHGAVLIRGLHLRDADQAGAVFRQLAPALLTDKEAFAPRQTYTPGVYSSSTWPPNQPMCMHHELSYTLQPPGLMLFACLTAPTTGGATAIAEGLPFNTRFGSGDPIGPDIIQLLNDTYTAHIAREPWQAGDLMLVDNVRTAHSREPFEGPREILVVMAEPVRLAGGAPGLEEGVG